MTCFRRHLGELSAEEFLETALDDDSDSDTPDDVPTEKTGTKRKRISPKSVYSAEDGSITRWQSLHTLATRWQSLHTLASIEQFLNSLA